MAKEPLAVKLTSLWIGGYFFCIIKGFRGKLVDQYKDEFENRNVWAGYFISLITTGILVCFLIET